MPDIGHDNELVTSSNCHIAGWGKSENGGQSAVILSTTVKIMSNGYCNSLTKLEMYRRMTGKFSFCAGLKEGKSDTCEGDSGGPLYCKHRGVYVLYGITSVGKNCAVANQPGIYTKVAKVISWIKEYTNGKCQT